MRLVCSILFFYLLPLSHPSTASPLPLPHPSTSPFPYHNTAGPLSDHLNDPSTFGPLPNHLTDPRIAGPLANHLTNPRFAVHFPIISLPLLLLLLNGVPLASATIAVYVPKYSKDKYVHVAVNKDAKIQDLGSVAFSYA